MSGAAAKAWAVAASVAAVEALKDQGFCRWNYTLRSLHHRAKNNLKSMAQDVRRRAPQSAAAVTNKVGESEKLKKSEESLKTVMYLSSWGPN